MDSTLRQWLASLFRGVMWVVASWFLTHAGLVGPENDQLKTDFINAGIGILLVIVAAMWQLMKARFNVLAMEQAVISPSHYSIKEIKRKVKRSTRLPSV